jgi:hypothetical protein
VGRRDAESSEGSSEASSDAAWRIDPDSSDSSSMASMVVLPGGCSRGGGSGAVAGAEAATSPSPSPDADLKSAEKDGVEGGGGGFGQATEMGTEEQPSQSSRLLAWLRRCTTFWRKVEFRRLGRTTCGGIRIPSFLDCDVLHGPIGPQRGARFGN